MKFPLAERPFPLLRLTDEERVELEYTVQSMVLGTVREYEHFAYIAGGRLSKKKWKAVKHRENLTVLRERVDRDELAALPTSAFDWSLPKLLMTGTVVGTLDDIMYGTLAPTSEAMRIRSAYIQDEVLDAEVLSEIQMPTPDEPFRFLGIKWSVRSHSSTLNPMASPRDTVFVEGTGIHVTPAGERFGYRVIHSVDLLSCRELKAFGIVRTRASSTSVFKQLPNGVVDVYMTRFVEATGSLSESTALAAAATSMLSIWKSVWCSQNKKLSCAAKDGAQKWALEGAGKIERLVVTTDGDGNYCCGLCYKHYKLYNSVITCQACNLMVCSKCQVGRKLARVGYMGEITQYPVLFCKNCISRSLKESAYDVAKAECASDFEPSMPSSPRDLDPDLDDADLNPGHLHKSTKRTGTAFQKMSVGTNSTITGSLDGLGTFDLNRSFATSYESGSGDVEIQTVDDWERDNDASFYMEEPPKLSAADTSELAQIPAPSYGGNHQQNLFLQMTQLCLAAEETYLLAKKNADAMRHQLPTYS